MRASLRLIHKNQWTIWVEFEPRKYHNLVSFFTFTYINHFNRQNFSFVHIKSIFWSHLEISKMLIFLTFWSQISNSLIQYIIVLTGHSISTVSMSVSCALVIKVCTNAIICRDLPKLVRIKLLRERIVFQSCCKLTKSHAMGQNASTRTEFTQHEFNSLQLVRF